MPPDDKGEAPACAAPAGPAHAMDEVEIGLNFAWAPFPVEFGGSWWLDAAPVAAADEAAAELTWVWAPFPVEFERSWWFDPEPQPVSEEGTPAPTRRQRASTASIASSLAIHFLMLLVLLRWTAAPAGLPGAIPVRLVMEQPKAETESPPPTPPEKSTRQQAKITDAQPPPKVAAAEPQSQAAAPERPPEPIPPPKPAPPKPAPPKPAPTPKPPRKEAAERRPEADRPPPPRPAPAVQQAQTTPPLPSPKAGPGAGPPGTGQSDYLSYLVSLTRRHIDLLPASFLAGRRGETVLSVLVLGDGTIGHIAIKRSSGYPDIDERVEQMVAAVGKFPPPPQRYGGPDLSLDFKLVFPDAVNP